MDIIYLTELKTETIIGIYDWERKTKQTISLNLEMATDIQLAAQHDHIDYTLNYKNVAKRLLQFIEESSFQLIETLAEQITQIILSEFEVPWVRLTLSKPGAIRGAKDVGIIIERGQKPGHG
ncbi:MAG TPA: dihydroneopterin aldolase [Gammaproteobacteria bacterium]|nr:dihydroneopterin aldolase [Gammaproteobacteria bacterium]